MFASVLSPLHWVNRIPRDGGPSPGSLFIMLTSYPFTLMSLWAPSHFLALFLQPRPFVFIILQLFCKNTRGCGIPPVKILILTPSKTLVSYLERAVSSFCV